MGHNWASQASERKSICWGILPLLLYRVSSFRITSCFISVFKWRGIEFNCSRLLWCVLSCSWSATPLLWICQNALGWIPGGAQISQSWHSRVCLLLPISCWLCTNENLLLWQWQHWSQHLFVVLLVFFSWEYYKWSGYPSFQVSTHLLPRGYSSYSVYPLNFDFGGVSMETTSLIGMNTSQYILWYLQQLVINVSVCVIRPLCGIQLSGQRRVKEELVSHECCDG